MFNFITILKDLFFNLIDIMTYTIIHSRLLTKDTFSFFLLEVSCLLRLAVTIGLTLT